MAMGLGQGCAEARGPQEASRRHFRWKLKVRPFSLVVLGGMLWLAGCASPAVTARRPQGAPVPAATATGDASQTPPGQKGTPASDTQGAPAASQSRPECALTFLKSGLCGYVTWTQGPKAKASSTFELQIWPKDEDGAGDFDDGGLDLEVILDMPSMGHGSTPPKVTALESGVFKVESVFFSMPGAWVIHLHLKRDGADLDEATLALQI